MIATEIVWLQLFKDLPLTHYPKRALPNDYRGREWNGISDPSSNPGRVWESIGPSLLPSQVMEK